MRRIRTGRSWFSTRCRRSQAGRRRSSTCGMPTPVPITLTVNHGVTKSVYFLDPDGNELEVYSDNPAEEVKTFENPYASVENLEFAQEDPGFRDLMQQGATE